MAVVLRICALFLLSKISQPGECLEHAVFRRVEQKYLANHVIATKIAATEVECGLRCIAEGSCVSVNYKIAGIDKGQCELNNKTLRESSDGDLELNPEFNHLYIDKVRTFVFLNASVFS
jgi:hypothetical protein